MSSTREHLLGYLLDALEPAEQAAVERELASHPELREELTALQATLLPLGFPDRDDDLLLDGPPPHLAEQAVDFVQDAVQAMELQHKPAKLTPVTACEVAPTFRRLSWADMIVAASVLLAAGALLFPAIASSRHAAQVTACQNHLRQVGQALAEFSERAPDHRIPAVPLRGPRAVAGIYASLLKDSELLPHENLLVCPSSDLAEELNRQPFQVPALAQIDAAFGETLTKLQRSLGGSYGYNLGFVEDGKYRTPKMEGRTHYLVMSDAPSSLTPARRTKNHNGRGQNLLFEDNHVRFVIDLPHELFDDPYHNRSGIIAAGEDRDDIVLGESNARPMPTLLQTVSQ